MAGETLFTSDQLQDHTSFFARTWHLARKAIVFVGWRTMQDHAAIVGTVIDGETDPDGDTCFDVVIEPNLKVHCEVDPTDLAALRPDLLKLAKGQRIRVCGVFTCDIGHGTAEIHPVRAIEFL